MEEIKLKSDTHGKGAFVLEEAGVQVAAMEVSIDKHNLTVYHTEVTPALEGKGVAKMLLDKMVNHARENNLKVIPLCSFVHAQFKRHPELFEDVWNKE